MTNQRKTLLGGAFSARTVIPNVVTLFAFISGITSIRFALTGRFELAVAAIVLAAVLDGLDGSLARLLRSTSRFGAELDSLSDNVAFGVAPALVLYLWSLVGMDRLGWAIALLYSVGMALRLARFNARMDEREDKRKRLGYHTGVPAPAGAGLLLAPLMVDFIRPEWGLQSTPEIVAIYSVLVSILMVSSLPTLSIKSLRVRREFFVPMMLGVAAMVGGLFVNAWVVLLIISGYYLASIPVTVFNFRRRVREKADKRQRSA